LIAVQLSNNARVIANSRKVVLDQKSGATFSVQNGKAGAVEKPYRHPTNNGHNPSSVRNACSG